MTAIGESGVKTRRWKRDPSLRLGWLATTNRVTWLYILGEGFFDLGGEFEGEGVETLSQVANILEKIVVRDEGGDGGEEARGGGNESFSDTRGDGAEAGGARSAEAGEGVDNAPNRAEEPDEGSDAGGGGEPGHTLFDAAHFVSGGELHADGDGLERLQFDRRGIAGTAELGLKFAIAGGVDVGEGRAGGHESLRIGDAFGGTKDLEELVALATDASEKARFLENEGPGNQRCKKKKAENEASDPAGLRENIEDVADDDIGKQRDDVSSSKKTNFRSQNHRSIRGKWGQKN
jgi:hypothetical protein